MTDSDPHTHPPYFPAPWNLKGEAYIILCSNTNAVNPSRMPGAYGLIDAKSDFANEERSGKFKGGMGGGLIQIMRYYSSLVGPYDELVYMPGQFETPDGNTHWRATNVYVSSEASIYNGRRIWDIPKHLAHFSFTPLPQNPNESTQKIHIQVFQPPSLSSSTPNSSSNPPTPTQKPFFSAICTPYRYIPSIPLNTSYIPFADFTFTQPPLPGSSDAFSEISTGEWRTLGMSMKGWARFMSVQSESGRPDERKAEDGDGGGEELGDGVYFPRVRPYVGVHLKGIEVVVFEPVEEVARKKTV